MKNFAKILVLAAGFLALTSASAKKAVDWQGAGAGAKVPKWVRLVAEENREKVAKELHLEGKHIFPKSFTGTDLDLLKIRVEKLNIGSMVARELSQAAASAVAETLDAVEDNGKIDKKSVLSQVEYNFTNLNLRGLRQEASFWTAAKNPARGKDKKAPEFLYTFYVVYSMTDDVYEESLNGALEKIDEINSEIPDLQKAITKKLNAFLNVEEPLE